MPGLKTRPPFSGILEHLLFEIQRVRDAHVGDQAGGVRHGFETRLDKRGVRRQLQSIDPRDDFVPQRRVDVDAVAFDRRSLTEIRGERLLSAVERDFANTAVGRR